MTLFIILILLLSIVTIVGVLVIKVAVQMGEQIYFPTKNKLTFKQQTKKRYEKKSTNRRIPISSKPKK
jgi:hypothetical protein